MISSPPRARKLRPNGTLGIVALSAPAERGRIDRACAMLADLGVRYKVVLDPAAAYGKKEFLFSSDTVARRCAGLLELLRDDEVDCIMSLRGAYGSMELLEHLPFGEVAKAGKVLCGYSDTTALLLPWVERAGVVAIHGPSLDGTFAKVGESEASKASAEMLLKVLRGEEANPFAACILEPLNHHTKAEGVILGGNLSMLVSLLGTPWFPDLQGKLLCLEEIGERPYRVHRMLMQLALAGVFRKVSGVLLGSFSQCVHPQGGGPTLEDVFADIFSRVAIPVMRGLPTGHDPLNLPLPLGIFAKIDNNQLELDARTVLI
jgi:muramoyltetrapeptide carboxypeptidase